MILAGDVGGTNTRLALYDPGGGRLTPVISKNYPSPKYEGVTDIIREFLEDVPDPPFYVCLGVAGPIREGRSSATNLPWVIESARIAEDLGLGMVEIINDLEALAHGISILEPDDFVILNEGDEDPNGNRALVAAGTGFGVAGLVRESRGYRPFPSEGGHTDFAPRGPLETDLLAYLAERHDHVSYERVISGPGLTNIYRFLRDTGRCEEPDWLAEMVSGDDPPAVTSSAALEGKSELCKKALDLFVSVMGAKAGNVALEFMATGGLFIGGGIAPKIIDELLEPTFMDAFRAKGRMKSLLEAVPVQVIRNDQAALLGAASLSIRRLLEP